MTKRNSHSDVGAVMLLFYFVCTFIFTLLSLLAIVSDMRSQAEKYEIIRAALEQTDETIHGLEEKIVYYQEILEALKEPPEIIEEEIIVVKTEDEPEEGTISENEDTIISEPEDNDINPPTGYTRTIGSDVDLPDMPTDRKVCTDYRVYNIPGTPHNRMQKLAYTDELGCRRYGDYYIVGLGSAYADRIGETFEVELETGVVFKIITGDMKPDDDTDVTNRFEACYNYDGKYCANVLEFIMDKEIFDIKAYQWGGVDYYEKFKGDIVRMTYLGRDTSADWDIYT